MQFSNAFSAIGVDRKLTKEELVRAIRQMICAEMDAANLYIQLAEASEPQHQEAAKILRAIATEELVHVGEFRHVLQLLDPADDDACKQGRKEAEKLLKATATDENAEEAGQSEEQNKEAEYTAPQKRTLKINRS
jgi:rubrerythrin